MKKLFVLVVVTMFSFMVVACGGKTESTSEAKSDFPDKLSAARKAESAFETALTAAPDLATAKASAEFTTMQKAMEEATAAAKTDEEKTEVANLQKLIDVLVNQ